MTGGRVRRLPRPTTPARSTRRCEEARRRSRSLRRDGDEFAVVTTDGAWRAAATSSSPPGGATARRSRRSPAAARRHPTRSRPARYRNPGELPRRRRARRRRLGDRRAARRRAARRRPRRRAGRRQPQPAAPPLPGHGHLLVARAHRRARPDDRRDAATRSRPATSRRCSSSAGRTTGRSIWPRCRPPASSWPAGWSPSTATESRFADDLAATVAAADAPRCDGCCAGSTGTSTATASATRCSSPEPLSTVLHAGVARRARPARGRASRTVVWATGHRRAYTGCRSPCSTRAARSASAAASHPVPGLYVLGQRFQHHRNSNFIDGVGRDAAFVADHITRRTARAASSVASSPTD